MSVKTVNYQCPACTGPLQFDGPTNKLKCEYCSNVYEVAEIEQLYQQKEAQAEQAQVEAEENFQKAQASIGEEWDVEGEGIHGYSCSSCGAELICDASTAATSCPYCGNPTVVPGKLSGLLKPDFVIPFKLDKKAAKEALKNHYKGKFLLPKEFSAENHIEEIKGVYVPFWLFDVNADADCSFYATTSITITQGDYRVTTTNHYDVIRKGNFAFQRIPSDASSKMPDDYMDSIEPFNYDELKEFSTAYLPGFLADKYDVEVEKCKPRVDLRCRNSAIDVARNDVVGYHTVISKNSNIKLDYDKAKYALLPVWVLATKWQDKTYLFAINGQTGKIVGDLPYSKAKLWKILAATTVGLTALFSLLGIGAFIAAMFV